LERSIIHSPYTIWLSCSISVLPFQMTA
jgi:hypothetical protein